MKKLWILAAAVLLLSAPTACIGSPSLEGNWQADDGSGMKVVMSDGRCSGMYYSGGEPLEIGGPMTCLMPSDEGSNGRYSLVVTQPPNQQTLYVSFNGDDEATIYDAAGNRLFSMTRQ